MIKLKSPDEIVKLKQGGAILAQILCELEIFTKENYQNDDFTALSIDKKTEELLNFYGAKSSFKSYRSNPNQKPFPVSICVSINDEVVHGIPKNEKLNEGDIVGLDLGIIFRNLYTDAAVSFILGEEIVGASYMTTNKKMVEVAREALYKGIAKAVVGNTIGNIGQAIEEYVLSVGFNLVKDYCGHGVGYAVHEEPSVPNCGKSSSGEILKEGMVIAIEPMVVLGDGKVYVDKNGWTVKTANGGRSAHWEHTVAITSGGPMILTE